MAWDFSTEPEFQEKLDWIKTFCEEEVEPLGYVFPYAIRMPDPKIKEYVKGLQDQIKAQGLWALFLDEELGGPGFGQLKLGLVNEILGRYPAAPQLFGAAAPDTGNMEMLAAYGTEEQKERWLKPLLNQEIFSAYSMTEPQGGSDPNLFRTNAVRDGEEWVINGEKWFTSAGRVADILFVMTVNGMFVVPRETPGVEIQPEPRNHNHIIYNDVRVPLDHLLGPEDGAKVLAQRRLGGGRIHHAMRTIAQCNLAFDMMCERALSRESHGKVIAEHQMVQEKIADSYASIKMLRLFVLETAWKMDQTSGQATRTDIAAVKFTMAKVLREVSFNALHILGSLGTTDLTPLQAMYAAAPTMGLADGADEVHKATVARNVLKDYRPHEGYWPTEYFPAKKEAAWKAMEPKFQADPELRKVAEGYRAYFKTRPLSAVRFTGRDGLDLAADVDGPEDGPPVVLLHGGGQTRHSWTGTWRVLADGGWRAWSIDLRGHGDSQWSPEGDYSLDAFSGDLLALIAHLGRPPVLVGASLGGLTSLVTAAEADPQADTAKAIVLVDVANRVEKGGRERIGAFMTQAPDGFASLEEASDAIAAYNPHRPRPKDLSGLAKNLRQREDGRWVWHWDPRFVRGKFGSTDETRASVIEPERLDRAADNLTIPALLVRGRSSDLLSEEGAQDFLRRVPHAEFADVAGAGHMVAGDKNEIFNQSILSFLDRHRD